MDDNDYGGFYARFLGGFSLFYQGREIIINKRLRQKSVQLLLILLKAGEKGIPRKKLVNMLEGGIEGWDNQLNNLRQQTYALRKLIERSGEFPEGSYVMTSQDGNYFFNPCYSLKTDTGQIDQLYQNVRDGAKGEERIRCLKKICSLYTGEFLPSLLGEEWATVESAGYQNIYFECLHELCAALKEQEAYGELLEFAAAASKIYPYDEWQKVQIDCLTALGRYREAMKLYEKTSGEFYEELGVSPFERQAAGYQGTWAQPRQANGALLEIRKKLAEKERGREAYCCSYPAFIDVFRAVARLLERGGNQAVIMVCTLTCGADGSLEKEMDRFQKCLEEGIRNCDVYTRYSSGQFLAILMGTELESAKEVACRLKKAWKAENRAEQAKVEFVLENIMEHKENRMAERR